MATLEDAAEELVIKLRGLESEIAESDQKLETLRERMEAAKRDLEEDWTDLTEAVESLLDKVREEGEQLDRQGDETLQAVTDAHNALGENATNARNEIGQAAAELDALGQQATALEQAIEPLVQDGIEAPAQALEDRAKELEQELGRLVDEARDFLVDDVVPAIEQVTEDVRERCQELHRSLTEDHTQPLQEVFDEWSGQIDELESLRARAGLRHLAPARRGRRGVRDGRVRDRIAPAAGGADAAGRPAGRAAPAVRDRDGARGPRARPIRAALASCASWTRPRRPPSARCPASTACDRSWRRAASWRREQWEAEAGPREDVEKVNKPCGCLGFDRFRALSARA